MKRLVGQYEKIELFPPGFSLVFGARVVDCFADHSAGSAAGDTPGSIYRRGHDVYGFRRFATFAGRHEAARERRSALIHRYYLDVILLLAGGWGYRTLDQSGTIITRNATGGLEFDPLLLLTPIVLVVGLAFLVLRFVPLLMRGLARLVAWTEAISLLFALRQVARTPTRYNSLILTFTLSLGLFTATVAAAFDRNYGDQALYAAGTDLRTHEFDFETASWYVRPLEEYRAIPGVVEATPARRVRLVGRQAQIQAQGFLLAIDPATFADVTWWRPDFRPSLAELLEKLGQSENAALADEPTGSVDTQTANVIVDLFRSLAHRYGVTVIIVTHDPGISQHVDRTIAIYDGRTSFERVRRTAADIVVGHDEYVMVDKVGRMQLPPPLVEKLGLNGRVRLHVGEDHLEIWPDLENR